MTALPATPDEQVRALAVAILKRSEFAFWHDTPWLISFLAWLSGLWETDPVLYYAMLVGLVAVALLLLAHVAWAVRRALAVAPPARRTAQATCASSSSATATKPTSIARSEEHTSGLQS